MPTNISTETLFDEIKIRILWFLITSDFFVIVNHGLHNMFVPGYVSSVFTFVNIVIIKASYFYHRIALASI